MNYIRRMNRIRKVFFLLTFIVALAFASLANRATYDQIESKKTHCTFSAKKQQLHYFLQPDSNFHLATPTKSAESSIIKFKWFSSLLVTLPFQNSTKPTSNFSNPFIHQSANISILLYPFHFFW